MWGLRIAHLKKHTKYKGIQTATSGMEIYCWKFWAVDPKYLCQLTPIYWSKYFTPAQWYRIAEFAARPMSITGSKRQAGRANRREASYVLFSPQGKNPKRDRETAVTWVAILADWPCCWKCFYMCPTCYSFWEWLQVKHTKSLICLHSLTCLPAKSRRKNLAFNWSRWM